MAETNGPKIVVSLWVMSALCVVFIALRLYCKARYTSRLGTDDAILVIAFIFSLIYSALATESVKYGMGKHIADVRAEEKIPMYKNLFIGEFFSMVAIPVSKSSFAITLLRLVARRWQKLFIWFIIITMNIALWLCGILLFVQCSPIEKNWNKTMPGRCWKSKVQDDFAVFAGAYSAFLDFVLATFPCIIIWNLQMNKREKVGVVTAMSLGFFAGATAAIKTSVLPGVKKWEDINFSLAELLIWSHAETSVTIMASCIPFFRLLIKHAVSRGSARYKQSYKLESLKNGRPRTIGSAHFARPADHDDMSETSILREAIQNGAIMKLNEINIEYHEKGTS